MEALKLQNREFNFTNYDDALAEVRKIFKADYTFTDFCNLRDWIINNESTLTNSLNKLTLPKLKERVVLYTRQNAKKPDYVEGGYKALLNQFDIGEQEEYRMVRLDYHEVHAPKPALAQPKHHKLIARVQAVTLEQYERKRAEVQAKVAAFEKALTNPETVEEFRTFVRYKGLEKLTPDQLDAYDKFVTDERREKRKRENKKHSVVGGVDLGDAQMEIIKNWHQKKEKDIWVVRLDQWIRRTLFEKLRTKAQENFDGYYSTYKENGAIPGFIFQSEETAKLFIQLSEGEVDVSSIIEEREIRKLERRSESLREKGERLIMTGEEEYNRERKANTLRRARMASNAEAAAARQIVWGKILLAIAEGQENGTIEYLDKFAYILDLETFEMFISQAKWRMIKEKEIPYRDQDALSLSTEWASYIKFPHPTLYIENCKQSVLKAQYEDGKIMAAKRFIKWFTENFKNKLETFVCTTEQAVEGFARIFVTDDPYCQYYYQLRTYNRVMRMNLQTLPELRTAIREYIRIKQTISLTPEQQLQEKLRELERSFIARKIPGFFPMTREMALSVIEKADIQPGHIIHEPSAGLGHLADAIAELHPENELHCTEINYELAKALEFKGHNITRGDFLQNKPEQPLYDRILMNPPFEDGQDNEHVMHAYNYHLKEGGILVAVMANNKGLTHSVEFRQWLDEVGAEIEVNPEGSFASAFRPTGVSTITVVIRK